jgi:protein-S-isoprenylcysteine O-methyltransferase Ste14
VTRKERPELRKDQPGVSIPLVMFAHMAVLLFLAAVPHQPPWWIVVSAVALVGTGIGAFSDSRRYRRKYLERQRRRGPS